MTEIPKAYEPQQVEAKWYEFWIQEECFKADAASDRPPFSMVIPPPNVTGILHLGHVLNNTIQDILARRARMLGKEVLWIPGTDHAGIATQVVVEKKLKLEEGVSRHDVGREKFVERVWRWKEKHGGIIINQLKKLGCSCDWSRERFTLDSDYSRKVLETFVDLYHKGLIFRGKRMVNWCPVSLTALSDEEVIMKPQNGKLYYFQVEVAEEPGQFLTIATTRPETIPGDTAVAVNPKDSRFSALIGKHVIRPIPAELPRKQKMIPIIGDEAVDFEFGTGVLKVTPAHDKADFDIGKRHNLAMLEVINADATMGELAGRDLKGLTREVARKKSWEILTSLGSAVKIEPYQNSVGYSERADVPIEPRLSEQWFLKYPSQKEALEVVTSGELSFYPDRWAKVYQHWMENIQDWCISRQLWWGHRIPVWYKNGEVKCQIDSPGEGWEQDKDVLDTWFSSWLWPIATMDEATFKKFYPTTVLVTAPEILFFWVARMIMAGYEYEGQKPFKDVYLTGIVRDKLGRKMSKSLGNSPDPLDMIARYGADAVRMGIMRAAPLGQDLLFDEQQVELGRNFCNKIWNACRFRQMQGGVVDAEITPELLTNDDIWMLSRLNLAIQELSKAFDEYNFAEAIQILYRFFWNEYCDWYVEAAKASLNSDNTKLKENTLAVIDFILSNTLRLFHPFLPFITEELWQGMGYSNDMPADQGGKTIMNAPFPKPFDQDFLEFYNIKEEILTFVSAKYDLVVMGRNLRREGNVASSKKVRFVIKPLTQIEQHDLNVLKVLLHAEPLEVQPGYEPTKGTPSSRNSLAEIYLPMDELIDVEAERAKLVKLVEKYQTEIQRVEQRLNNPNFVDKAPPAVLEENRKRLFEYQTMLNQTQNALKSLDA